MRETRISENEDRICFETREEVNEGLSSILLFEKDLILCSSTIRINRMNIETFLCNQGNYSRCVTFSGEDGMGYFLSAYEARGMTKEDAYTSHEQTSDKIKRAYLDRRSLSIPDTDLIKLYELMDMAKKAGLATRTSHRE